LKPVLLLLLEAQLVLQALQALQALEAQPTNVTFSLEMLRGRTIRLGLL
jgi:hypothetical protein